MFLGVFFGPFLLLLLLLLFFFVVVVFFWRKAEFWWAEIRTILIGPICWPYRRRVEIRKSALFLCTIVLIAVFVVVVIKVLPLL